jgi:hypothetical protein
VFLESASAFMCLSLKQELVFPPILIYPVLGKQFILDTDASHFAVGAVLSQEVDGREHVIAYMSKALNKHETSYCTTRQELLAVIVAIKNFHPYVYGQNILLRTDKSAVSWMQSLKNPTGQVARSLQQLATYNLQIIHRAGKRHINADALSTPMLVYLFLFQLLPLCILCSHLRVAVVVFLLVPTRTV